MKTGLRVLCLAILAMLVAPQSSSGAATSSYVCLYPKGKYIVPSGSQTTYACPTPAPVPSGYTAGRNASTLQNAFGMNIHLTYARYSNYAYVKALLQSLGVKYARDNGIANISSGNPTLIANFNDLAASGIALDLITNNGNSASYIDGKVAQLAPGTVSILEGPNEMNLNEPSTYITDGPAMMQAITNGVETQPHLAGITIYGASLSNADYSVWGDLSGYMHHGNMHNYMGGRMPETAGWGSLGYCNNNYQTIVYAACDAQQSSPARDVIATENGYCTAAIVGCVPEDTQALYAERLLMQQFSLGVPLWYNYELIANDTTTADGTYGWTRPDFTQKPVIPEMAGFMAILHDPSTRTGTCNVPVTLGTPSPSTFAVRMFGVCKASGEVDVAIWLPAEDYNTTTQAYDTVNPETVAVNIAPGFTVTSSSQWTVDRTTGLWTPNPSWTPGNVSVTGPVQVITINGPTPTPLPTMPTTPP